MTWRGQGPDWLDEDEGGYTFLVLAAHEARKERRRYWARDGPADRKYPPQPLPWWPLTPGAGGSKAIERRAEGRRWIKPGNNG